MEPEESVIYKNDYIDFSPCGPPRGPRAAVLGNSPAVVQKHYTQWIKSRQDRLDAILTGTGKTKLRRVK